MILLPKIIMGKKYTITLITLHINILLFLRQMLIGAWCKKAIIATEQLTLSCLMSTNYAALVSALKWVKTMKVPFLLVGFTILR